MVTLTKPSEKARELFVRCANSYGDELLRKRLVGAANDIENAAVAFDAAAASSALHLYPSSDGVGNAITKAEMCALYDNKIAKKPSPGREFYDQLMMSPKLGICPLCAQRVVSTLDHHLPKGLFPALAVVPANLIPACMDCNKSKGTTTPTAFAEQTLHPYYDDFTQARWLCAQIIEDEPPALTFSVKAPSGWTTVTVERLERHLRVFKLGRLYASHAGQELVSIRKSLGRTAERSGVEGVREVLREQADSRAAVSLNSWQTATYSSLADSDWFCAEGFAKIPSG